MALFPIKVSRIYEAGRFIRPSAHLHTSNGLCNTPQVILVWSISLITCSGIQAHVPIVSVNVQVLTRCLFHTNWIAVISVYVFIFVLSNCTSIHRSFSSSPSPEPSVLLSTPSSLQSILCLSDGRSDHHSGGAFGWRLLQLSGSEHRRQCDHQSPAGGYRRWDRWSRSERKSLGEVTPKNVLYLNILDW